METRAATRTNVCNVLIIGSGAAGLRAAIAAHQAGVKALVIGKRQRLTVSSQPVPPVPDYLEEWARDGRVIELKGRLLE